MKQIPLRGRDGSVRAHATVDDADWGALSERRWCLNSKGYATRRSDGRTVRMHRQILGLEHGDPRQGDHINGDKLDNRRANLRVVTNAENQQNVGVRVDSSSGYRGVSWHGAAGRWQARVQVAGRRVRLGFFETAQEAARAAEEYRHEVMPYARPSDGQYTVPVAA